MPTYNRQSYFMQYGTHPLASYYLCEYKNPIEAEHRLISFMDRKNNKKNYLFKIKNILNNFFHKTLTSFTNKLEYA